MAVFVHNVLQAGVGCNGAKVLKSARGAFVNIRRRNVISVFKVGAATKFIVLNVNDVGLKRANTMNLNEI